MIDFEKIQQLRQQIRDLIAENPELQKLQDQIDAEMEKCGNNAQRRNAVIQSMLVDTWFKVIEPMETLGKPYVETELNAVKLRCTGKDCVTRKGVWVKPEQVDIYLEKLTCQVCGSKYARMMELV